MPPAIGANTSPPRVMMIGTQLGTKGGISTVIQSYRQGGIMSRLGIRYYPTHREGSKKEKIVFYLKAFLTITGNMPRFKVVHFHTASKWSYRRHFPLIVLARFFGKKVALHLHGGAFPAYYRRARILEKFFIRAGFFLSNKVVVLSPNWTERVKAFCRPGKLVIIPNSISSGASLEGIREKNVGRPRPLLFMGALTGSKGVYDLLQAMKELNADSTECRLYLCGEGEKDTVSSRVASLGLEKKVRLLGWVSGEEKRQLLEGAYLSILPSYQEGLPMSILEAMAFGIPVIATPVGDIPDIVKEGYNGFLVPPRSPRKIAERIQDILGNGDLWSRMSVNAWRTIKDQFSLEETERRLGNLYDSLI